MFDHDIKLTSIKMSDIDSLVNGISKNKITDPISLSIFQYYNSNIEDDNLDEVEMLKLKSDIAEANKDENKDVFSLAEAANINIEGMKVDSEKLLTFIGKLVEISDEMSSLTIKSKSCKEELNIPKVDPLTDFELKAHKNKSNTAPNVVFGKAKNGAQYVVFRHINKDRTSRMIARDDAGNPEYIVDVRWGRCVDKRASRKTAKRVCTIYRSPDGKTLFYIVPKRYDKKGNGIYSEIYDKNNKVIGYEECSEYRQDKYVNGNKCITYYNADKTKSNTYFLTKDGDIDLRKLPILAEDQSGLVHFDYDVKTGVVYNVGVFE